MHLQLVNGLGATATKNGYFPAGGTAPLGSLTTATVDSSVNPLPVSAGGVRDACR